MCGEHVSQTISETLNPGSSPRVRGTLRVERAARQNARFIPACAGNTCRASPTTHPSPVHPRVCGEHRTSGIDANNGTGSSPRVRGTRRWRAVRRPLSRVHPRVCGEHRVGPAERVERPGSSPRVRGTPLLAMRRRRFVRFIPACAGNTATAARPLPGVPVHPRVCGEHEPIFRPPAAACGSSPRVRGTRRGGARRAGGVRFIPACAGNTLSISV